MKNCETTELINRDTVNIDIVGTADILTMINNEDMKVALAVRECLPEITKGVDIIVKNFLQNGRLIYVGAGTSGRLGVLDASECATTYSINPDMIKGVIAGGDRALKENVEGADDSESMARRDFDSLNICEHDTIVGISACGNAKYVAKFLEIAKLSKCKVLAITSNPQARVKQFVDCFICVKTGAEAITGSTRMKAGTAQKMVLNMLSTAAMVKIGKTYHNLMIDVNPTNEKLKRRALAIVQEITGRRDAYVLEVLEEYHYKLKHAVLHIMYDLTYEEADRTLAACSGVLRKALEHLDK